MVARCHDSNTFSSLDTQSQAESRKRKKSTGGIESTETSHSECSWGKASRRHRRNQLSQKMQLYSDGDRGMRLLEVDSESYNSTIEYNMSYRLAECQGDMDEMGKVEKANLAHADSEALDTEQLSSEQPYPLDVEDWDQPLSGDEMLEPDTETSDLEFGRDEGANEQFALRGASVTATTSQCESTSLPPLSLFGRETGQVHKSQISASTSGFTQSSMDTDSPQQSSHSVRAKDRDVSMGACASTSSKPAPSGDKYLIFTTGLKTYTPHQIGIKKITSLEAVNKVDSTTSSGDPSLLPNVADNDHGIFNGQNNEFDTVDHLIELHGHIIGMCLSPDHR